MPAIMGATHMSLDGRKIQIRRLLREAGAVGLHRGEVARLGGISPIRAAEVLRLLRDGGECAATGQGRYSRWVLRQHWAANEALQADDGDDDPRDEDDPLVTCPVIHRSISATKAPPPQRTKPYSVFTLSAA